MNPQPNSRTGAGRSPASGRRDEEGLVRAPRDCWFDSLSQVEFADFTRGELTDAFQRFADRDRDS